MTEQTLPPPAQDPDRRTWLLAPGAAGGVAAMATAVPFVATFSTSRSRAARLMIDPAARAARTAMLSIGWIVWDMDRRG